ncbi:carbamoyl-phosphate synthase, small subunit [Bifidobacterium dolichotidis]|uniref:Carbamoyl phosphate synthase small chain n=1 Tax=Bifidobacterium dolichotidis TaxID=2306976 RepID=A0A430FPK5_9BIFI|nr:glutamine-hydrolyzing carbamoyl-phosphate synthase small subunit [Bifidobacterium dolichotidis]RSX54767.1 carbamoyl-phosphate synthase, small subunit [Bifidobacterium dolichotidis]
MSQIDLDLTYDLDDAVLVLEDGQIYIGRPFGATGSTTAEIVFTTGMTGYQETLTDPSYDRQIVVQTFPHIGDTGVNDEDNESSRIWVAGYVVRDPSPTVSNWRATGSLDDALIQQQIVGISDIDTRSLVRHLRTAGVMRAGIFSGAALRAEHAQEGQNTGIGPAAAANDTVALKTVDELLEEVRATAPMQGMRLYDEVSTNEAYVVEPTGAYAGQEPRYTVAAIDLGIKGMTPHRMAERGARVHVLPSTTTLEQIQALHPDGVFFSNGPGDPEQAPQMIELLRQVLEAGLPFFGICFGNQLLGRALGFGTYKLKFGHRGVNQPVMDVTTGKVEITAQNHGFAVDAPIGSIVETPYNDGQFGKAFVSHVGLNDDVVEGLQCIDIPAFSVQYHPEAAAGPHDAAYLFDRFMDMMASQQPVPAPASVSYTSSMNTSSATATKEASAHA